LISIQDLSHISGGRGEGEGEGEGEEISRPERWENDDLEFMNACETDSEIVTAPERL
jgi:hypothetical protein